jgi:hypothetical protein
VWNREILIDMGNYLITSQKFRKPEEWRLTIPYKPFEVLELMDKNENMDVKEAIELWNEINNGCQCIYLREWDVFMYFEENFPWIYNLYRDYSTYPGLFEFKEWYYVLKELYPSIENIPDFIFYLWGCFIISLPFLILFLISLLSYIYLSYDLNRSMHEDLGAELALFNRRINLLYFNFIYSLRKFLYFFDVLIYYIFLTIKYKVKDIGIIKIFYYILYLSLFGLILMIIIFLFIYFICFR